MAALLASVSTSNRRRLRNWKPYRQISRSTAVPYPCPRAPIANVIPTCANRLN